MGALLSVFLRNGFVSIGGRSFLSNLDGFSLSLSLSRLFSFPSSDLDRRPESLRLRFSSRFRDVERLERRDLDRDRVRCLR